MRSLFREFSSELLHDGESGDQKLRPVSLGRLTYIASSVINVLALALPLTILQVYDRVLPNSAYETLAALLVLLSGAIIIDGLLKYFRSTVINWSAASFTHMLSVRGLTSMLSARPSGFSTVTTSEHLERLNAIQGLGNHYSAQSRTVIVDVLFIPVFSAVIILIGGALFATVVGLFALFGYLAMNGSQALNDAVSERESFDARKQDFIIEVLRAVQTVKACAMEPQIMRRFESLQAAASVVTRRMIKLTGAAQTYNSAYASLSTVVIVSCGAILVLNGRLTLGALACCMLLSSQLLQPLMRSLSSWNEIKLAQHRRQRVASIFDTTEAESLTAPRFPDRFTPKAVELRNVAIQFGESAPLFENLNLRIEAGEFIAITGADGCGRTTLLRSLIQDAPITYGEIQIGEDAYGPDAQNCSRRHVRYVGLNPAIFRGTILENITLFGETPAKVALSAAKFTGLDDEVVRMPLGYDTVLKSSAGRDIPSPTAQCVTLTRALAMRPSVLILDEANTLLDMNGEQRFIDALSRLHGRVTTIIATHRPSLLRLADKTYSIQNGSLSLVSAKQNERRVS
ncbi:ABC transporter transmembrane domain-containing protein [Hyphococcus sp.]|uniref:ABC transporter transmembrane domain-containing protein n=1 Tax=Hyphococcus sp. TaxID=2038636 RepID=UPI002087A6E5|nr:MAG: toxin ABC transporter [Marinicaulis sp.]